MAILGVFGVKKLKKIFCSKLPQNDPKWSKNHSFAHISMFFTIFCQFSPTAGWMGLHFGVFAHTLLHIIAVIGGQGLRPWTPPEYVKFGQKTCKNALLMALGTILDHFGVIWDEKFFSILDPKRP